MNRCRALLWAMTVLEFALLAGQAMTRQKSIKEQLVGAWTILTDDTVLPDGNKPNSVPIRMAS